MQEFELYIQKPYPKVERRSESRGDLVMVQGVNFGVITTTRKFAFSHFPKRANVTFV